MMPHHARTKHINVTYHFIHEWVTSNEVALTYIRSKENLADLMTKALDLHQHRHLCAGLGFRMRPKLRGSVGMTGNVVVGMTDTTGDPGDTALNIHS